MVNVKELPKNKQIALDFCIAGNDGIIADRHGKHIEISNMDLFNKHAKKDQINMNLDYLLAVSVKELKQRRDYKNLKIIFKFSLEDVDDSEGIKYGWVMHRLFNDEGEFQCGKL